ncbi:MAG: hypothetical protein Q4E45_05215 [Eubacteriales bacterium]|nr:hypothetical protein [Eubacteriales bacterium]
MNANMKKMLVILVVLASVLAGCAATMNDDFLPDTQALPFATPTPIPQLTLKDVPSTSKPASSNAQGHAPAPTPTAKPISPEVVKLLGRNLDVWRETQERPGMDGRLVIPSAGIDVALFSSGDGESVDDMRQRVTDAYDSALLYYDGLGFVIADHSNQAFASLPLVRSGDTAYILEGNSILTLTCNFAIRGVNTGAGITDADGDPVTQDALFTCYTCGEDWTQIHIVGLKEADEDLFAISRDADMPGGWRYANNALNEVAKQQIEEARELAAQRAAEAARAAAAEQQQQGEDLYN